MRLIISDVSIGIFTEASELKLGVDHWICGLWIYNATIFTALVHR